MADALFVVVTGRFTITLAGQQRIIAEIGPGQPIGEIAFLAGGPRTATVTALRDSVVLRLGREDFDMLAARNPGILRTLTVTLARRVAEANVSVAPPPDPRPRTIALIRAGGGIGPSSVCRPPRAGALALATQPAPARGDGKPVPPCRRGPRQCRSRACAQRAGRDL